MANLDFFKTYSLIAVEKEIVPKATFFKDRYFPTGAGDIFSTDKVITEYKNGDRKMAAFVSERAGDIPVSRTGYAIHAYEPAYIAPSRVLTVDELKKRGFGEALYATTEPAARAAMIIRDDLIDLENRIIRREEWMCAQTMINNACTMQTYIDGATAGETNLVQFYDNTSDHTYTISTTWDAEGGDFFGDVKNMCRLLSRRGLPAADLILGTDTADAILKIQEVRDLLNKNSGIIIGQVEAELSKYDGVAFLGTLNFGGFRLNLISVDETYVADNGSAASYFPAKGALVTAPNCGHMMYGAVTQIDYGATEFATYTGARIPKFSVDQDADIRKIRVASKPLAAPSNYCPYIYAANAVS